MTALLYFLVAVFAAGTSTRAWLMDRNEAARVAFLGLGWCVAIAYAAFALSLLPGLAPLRAIYMTAGTFVPAFSLWTVDRVFGKPDAPRSPWTQSLFLVTVIVAPTCAGAHLLLYADAPRTSPPAVVSGIFTFLAFCLTLVRLWEAHQKTGLRVEQVRLRYLLGFATSAALFTLLEQIARIAAHPVDPAGMSLSTRGLVLQGALPPLSVLLTAVVLYFLYQTLVMYRLLDLNEMFSHIATLVVSAFLLVLVDGVTVMWVGTFTDYPFHSTFQIFLASLLFLAAYDPLKSQIEWAMNRLFNQRGQQLADTLASLHAEIPTVIATRGLTELLLSRLHASGRVPVCSLYLFDPGRDAFILFGERSSAAEPPLAVVAAHPFTDGLAEGTPWYMQPTLKRRARADETAAGILAIMDAMHADLTLPFVSRGGVVLGWLNLRDENWSDGFSAEEIQRLQETVQLASVVLSNIQDFQALEEEHRLAALGAMAAGLAHEIRNPLAGIKGAAQFLQAENFPGQAQEMLEVVLHEVDRLNLVVSQFLDYARPFELEKSIDHVNALATHALALLKAQGIPEHVTVVERLSGDLPSMPMDRTRLSQVLINLLQNALQAMDHGGVLTVATRMHWNRSGQRMVELAVSDTGAGIDDDDMEKLFIPFFTTKKGGTGLGLPICQRIVQAHGGEIDVQSTPRRGASFYIRLPLPRDQAQPGTEESAA